MKFLSSIVLATGLMNLSVSSNAAPNDQFVFGSQIEVSVSYHYGMHQPPAEAEVLLNLRKEAEVKSKQVCKTVFGSPMTSFKVSEERLSQSILAYHLDTLYFCGKKVFRTSEVVSPLIHALSQFYDLEIKTNHNGTVENGIPHPQEVREVAKLMLTKVGPIAESALVDLYHDISLGETNARQDVIEIMGNAMRGGHPTYFQTLLTLGLEFNDYADFALKAAAVFPDAARNLAFQKTEIISRHGLYKYLLALIEFSKQHRVGSFTELPVSEYLSLLLSDISNIGMVTTAITERRVSDAELPAVLLALQNQILKIREDGGSGIQEITRFYAYHATEQNNIAAGLMKESLFVVLTKEELLKYETYYHQLVLGLVSPIYEGNRIAEENLIASLRALNHDGAIGNTLKMIELNATNSNLQSWAMYLGHKL